MDVRKIFEYALQREYEGKHFFEENSVRLNNAVAASAFKELAAEEQKHIEFIQTQLASLDKGQLSSAALAKELNGAGFFSARAGTMRCSIRSVLEAMVPDLPVLRTAYLIERDFADFYENSSQQADGEAKKVLEMLAKWERGHEVLFKNMHDKAYEVYNQMPWGG